MDPFHKRHKFFLIAAAFGGFYIEAIEKLVPRGCLKKFLRAYSVIALTVVTLSFLSSIIHLFFKAKLLSEYFFDLQAISANILVSLNVAYIALNKKQYFHTFTKWDKMFTADSDAESRQIFMKEEVEKTMRVMKVCSILISSLPIWMLSQFFLPDKTLKFPVAFEYRHQSPDFEIVVATHFLNFCWFSSNTITLSVLQLLPLCWEVAELRRLKWKICEIVNSFSNVPANHFTGETLELRETDLNRKLKIWITQHQNVCRYHSLVNSMYLPQLGVQLCSTMMTSWMTAYVIAAAVYPVEDIIANVMFFMPQYIIFFTACKVGHQLMEESTSIFDEALEKGWYDMPLRTQKEFLFIITRSQKLLVFKGLHMYPLGFRTFFQIFRTSYTFLNGVRATIR